MYTCAYIFTSYLHFKHLAEFGIYVRNSIYETAVTFCAQNRAEFKTMYYEKKCLNQTNAAAKHVVLYIPYF